MEYNWTVDSLSVVLSWLCAISVFFNWFLRISIVPNRSSCKRFDTIWVSFCFWVLVCYVGQLSPWSLTGRERRGKKSKRKTEKKSFSKRLLGNQLNVIVVLRLYSMLVGWSGAQWYRYISWLSVYLCACAWFNRMSLSRWSQYIIVEYQWKKMEKSCNTHCLR